MASGKQHERALLISFPFVLPTALLLLGKDGGPFDLGYICGGLFLDPDLDMEEVTAVEERLLRRVPPLGVLFVLFWYPFALIAKHRGLSHTPIVGTLFRAGYLLVMSVLSILALGSLGQLARWLTAHYGWAYEGGLDLVWSFKAILSWFRFLWTHARFIGFFLSGWALADLLHLFFDMFPDLAPSVEREREVER